MSRKKTNKIEAETGEVVQSNKPFIIRNGGIAKPLGQGLYLLGGKTHEQGGIDIDFTGDARIFSAQPILNGNSPAELVTRGANPNQTFIRQERFKDVNGINDDGSRKAKCGKRIKAENGTNVEQKAPTREEYITSKIDSVKANALNNMLSREIGVQPILRIKYADNIENRRKRSQELVSIADDFQARALRYADDGKNGMAKALREEAIHYYNEAEKALTHCKNDTIFGAGCIYTSTDAYGKQHRVSGNQTFQSNPQNYGFIKVDTKKRQPGDLQQVVGINDNIPVHMMMFDKYDENGKPIYVYNEGGGTMKHGRYPIDEAFRIDTYRFVGTPQDSTRWNKEYDKIYVEDKKRLGGRPKAEWGMEEGGLADTLTDIIPVIGSAKDITRLIRNPSWKQAGRTLFSVGTDILGYKTLAGVAKLAKASKAGKMINKIDDVLYDITPNINNKFTNFLDNNYNAINKVLTETGISAIGELIQQNNDMKNKENSNKKRLGGSTGLIRVQANGKDRLMYVPFTGEETKANRKKAVYGIELNAPKLFYDFTKVDKIMESLKEGDKNKNWWKNNGNYVISGLGNIGAGLTSYFINKNMLKDLNYVPAPIAKMATKLKTNININPELTALNENLYKTIDSTNANIASNRVANAMNQAAMLNTTLAKNKLYADKENKETALINQDRLNQQEVANANIDAYNTWRTGKTDFENTIREKQSENSISLVDSINSGIQGGITDYEKRRQLKNNLAVMAAAYPNVTPKLLRSYGFDIELPTLTKFGGKVKLNKKK